MAEPLVLPRPGTDYPNLPPVPAPSEEDFTSTFGALLPAAQYLTTPRGKAAYYIFPPFTSSSQQPSQDQHTSPKRVLLVHGVQTPALGLVPLTTALRKQFPAATFLVLDLWGHGLSETPVEPHSAELFAGLVDAVLGQVGWKNGGESGEKGEREEVAVVGYSFGSVVSMTWLTSFAQGVSEEGEGEGEEEEKAKGKGHGNGTSVHSLTLIAPAGLLKKSWFSVQEQTLLSQECSAEDEEKAADFVVQTLEGGPLTVPADWEERVKKGEVVAQAVKDWQIRHHAGHKASVVGVFRDGGVFENEELFRRARDTGAKSLVVLGELDELSTEEEIRALGFETRVVLGAGHAVVRDRAGEVAERIGEFWRGV